MPFLEWTQFIQLATALYRAHNEEHRHQLEGWRECNHMVNEWRAALDMPWENVRTLMDRPAEERAILEAALMTYQAKLTRTRQMNRWEVYQRGWSALTRLQLHAWPIILGPENGVERKVRDDDAFEWQDSDTSPAPWRDLARVDGRMLPRGEKYLTYHNSYAPDRLVLCDAKGRFVGSCRSWNGVGRSDEAARIEQASIALALEREKLDKLARTMAPVSVKALGSRRRNHALVAEALQNRTSASPQLSSQDKELAAMAEAALERRAAATATVNPAAVEITEATTTQEVAPNHAVITPRIIRIERDTYDPFAG